MSDIDQIASESAQTRVHEDLAIRGVGVSPITIFPFFRPRSDLDIPRWAHAGRDALLDRVWRVSGADMVASAISIFDQKVQSTGYVIEGPERTVNGRARPILDMAEYGKGFMYFVSKWVQAFLTHDNGVFTELIAPAPPVRDGQGKIIRFIDGAPIPDLAKERVGPVISIAVMDSTRCERTGDFNYPVRYYDLQGKQHLIHRTRVHIATDMPSTQEWLFDYGFCALSRTLATLHYSVNWATARDEMLDDMPPLGAAIWNGINKDELKKQMAEYQAERRALNEHVLRSLLTIVNQNSDKPASLTYTSFRQLWESFDEQKAFDVCVDMVAMGFGMDRQDLAPLATSAMGSGAQSTVLNQKASGKGPGHVMSEIEQMLGQILPASCSFKYDFQDDEQDTARIQVVSQKVNTVVSLFTGKQGGITGQPVPGASFGPATAAPTGNPQGQPTLSDGSPNPFAGIGAPNPATIPGPTDPNVPTPESLIDRNQALQILMYEVPEWADIIDPDSTIRENIQVDELDPQLAQTQQKMYGDTVRYNSKSRKTVRLKAKRPRLANVPPITDLEIQQAIRDLTEMGIDINALRERQYAE